MSARRIFISKNNGGGSFATPLVKVVNPFPGPIAGGDFNKDGNIDLVTGQSLSIDLHLGTGTGDFQPPLSFATEQSPYDLIAVDLNGDGNLDIAACTEYTVEGMSVLLGNGDGTFRPTQNYQGAYSPDLRNESGITSGDVDGDGDIDLLVGGAASNDISVYLNKGNGTFTFKNRYGVYYSASSPIYADFTGDGRKDIAAVVALPPGGFQSALAIMKGRVLNAQTVTAANKSVHKTTGKISLNNEMTVLNNPFGNVINVKFAPSFPGKVVFQLADVTGHVVARWNLEAHSPSQFSLPIDKHLSGGMYLLHATTGGFTYTKPVMKL